MDKPTLINKIKTLEGLSNDEKADLINLLNESKQYGLVWEDKIEDIERHLLTMLPILLEMPKLKILASELVSVDNKPNEIDVSKSVTGSLFPGTISEDIKQSKKITVNQSVPNHILIEGDNLHALTALTFTHESKIDVIFIDPPYNTGNKDFKYNDKFVDKTDSFRHSKWLTFMEKRLTIAKRLLNNNGFIFITIDDNEQSPLKLLCDEIFEEDLFVANFLWKKKGTSTNVDGVQVSSLTDYVLCYRKTKTAKLSPRITLAESRKYPNSDSEGNYRTTVIEKKNSGGYRRDTMMFKIIGQNPRPGKRWQIGETTARDLETKNRFLIEDGIVKLKIYDFEDEDTSSAHPNLLDKHGSSDSAAKMVNDEILGVSEKFNNPKPIELVSFLVDIANSRKDIIVLDFFAGSGSTLHAVMKLNSKDNGNRTCIMVTNNENNICEEVTYPRSEKVIRGYKFVGKKKEKLYTKNITLNIFKKSEEILEEIEQIKDEVSAHWDSFNTEIKDGEIILWGMTSHGQNIPGLTNNNLRYYKTGLLSSEKSNKNKKNLTLQATELLCIKEDIYNEITQINDFIFDPNTARCFSENGRFLLIIYDEEIIEQMVPVIAAIKSQSKIKVYVFAPGQYPFTEEFEEVLHKIELGALPDAIYKAYMAVLPKKSDRRFIEDNNTENEGITTEDETEVDLFTENNPGL